MPPLGKWLGLALATTSTLVVLSPAAPAPAAPDHPAHHQAGQPHKVTMPTLLARATISADHLEPGPPSGALATPANGRTGPFAGQVIPGFSAVVEGANGRFYAQPDNGFGTKANSADFLLRIYVVKPEWETGDGGPGRIEIKSFISLRDPDHKIDFPIVNDATTDRLLTGADFDIESLVRSPDGTFWIGDEFGPFLLHVSATGKLLRGAGAVPGRQVPAEPLPRPGQAPGSRASRGFEAMGGSADGSTSTRSSRAPSPTTPTSGAAGSTSSTPRPGSYTGKRWAYQVDEATNFVGDAFTVKKGRLLVDRARQLRRAGRRDQADLRGRPRHTEPRASSRSRSSSTSSRSPTPTASAAPRRPARTASATRSPSRWCRWRQSSSCATATCSSPTTTTTPATTPGTQAPPTTPRW